MRGHLFHYQVSGYNSKQKVFELTYMNYHISAEGDQWIVDEDTKQLELETGEPPILCDANYDLVWKGDGAMT